MRGLIGILLFALICAGTPVNGQPASDIYLRVMGEGRDCWVLLHPFGASGRFWERRAALLAREHGVRVYSPDLPSHGASRIVARFTYDDAARAVRVALRPVCPRPTLVVGASSGGIVAMKLGAATGAGVAAIGVGWSFSNANLAAMRTEATPSDGARAFQEAFAEQGEAQAAALRRHFGDLAASGTGPLLSRGEARALRGRLLIVNGEADDFFLPDSARQLATAVPGSRLELLAEAGHLGPLGPPHADRLWALVGEAARR
jgi:3-oxoadipate enol-lactonase